MEIKKNSAGSIVIAPEVVEKTATDIAGVADVVARTLDIKTIVKTRRVTKPVICVVKDGHYIIDIFLKVKEGVKLAELASQVQSNIKEAVQNMTGTVVSKINVHICEVQLKATEDK